MAKSNLKKSLKKIKWWIFAALAIGERDWSDEKKEILINL